MLTKTADDNNQVCDRETGSAYASQLKFYSLAFSICQKINRPDLAFDSLEHAKGRLVSLNETTKSTEFWVTWYFFRKINDNFFLCNKLKELQELKKNYLDAQNNSSKYTVEKKSEDISKSKGVGEFEDINKFEVINEDIEKIGENKDIDGDI